MNTITGTTESLPVRCEQCGNVGMNARVTAIGDAEPVAEAVPRIEGDAVPEVKITGGIGSLDTVLVCANCGAETSV